MNSEAAPQNQKRANSGSKFCLDHRVRREGRGRAVACDTELTNRLPTYPHQHYGTFGSGAAAVDSAADSVVARSCGCLGGCVGRFGWLCLVRFVCVIRVPVCALVCRPCVSRLPSAVVHSTVYRSGPVHGTGRSTGQNLSYRYTGIQGIPTPVLYRTSLITFAC